jgi:hypothetical protein
MLRRITAVTLILLSGCGGTSGWLGSSSRNALSYSQYHSLERGMRAKAILKAFGDPVRALEQEGKVRGLTYSCENANGQVVELRMVFDAEEWLKQWVLRDPESAKAGSVPPASAP